MAALSCRCAKLMKLSISAVKMGSKLQEAPVNLKTRHGRRGLVPWDGLFRAFGHLVRTAQISTQLIGTLIRPLLRQRTILGRLNCTIIRQPQQKKSLITLTTATAHMLQTSSLLNSPLASNIL